MKRAALVLAMLAAGPARADDPDHAIQIHGFISEGGFLSTDNDYIGSSTRGSLEFFEAGINASTEVADRLRAGIQFFGRDVGTFRDLPPRLDWAFLDYRWRDYLGLRAGIIKMPFGLYNEYADIDSARTSILMPQSVYSVRNRSALLAQTGFSLYGFRDLGHDGGSIDYQAWFGTLNIPDNALTLDGAHLDSIDTRYVTGGQLFWRTPVDGLKVGATYVRASFDFNLTFNADTLAQLVALGYVSPAYDGKIGLYQHPDQLGIASAEYTREDWQFAAEYMRSYTHTSSTLSTLVPVSDATSEHFYVLASHRLCRCAELGAYYSVMYADVNDRHGNNKMAYPQNFLAWQRDAALTLRYDINDHWLWKVEGHFIDGAADLDRSVNPNPTRYWGLFLFKTTVTF
jgi:hypothetical protein